MLPLHTLYFLARLECVLDPLKLRNLATCSSSRRIPWRVCPVAWAARASAQG